MEREIEIESVSTKNLGIKAKSGLWYNVPPDLDEIKKGAIRSGLGELKPGDKVELSGDLANKYFETFVLKGRATASSSQSNDRDVVNFSTLLDAAHKKKKPFSIETELIHVDWEKKIALFKATLKGYTTENQIATTTYTGYGEVTPENVGQMSKHWLRFGESRAIIRSLKLYCNNTHVSEEELGGDKKK